MTTYEKELLALAVEWSAAQGFSLRITPHLMIEVPERRLLVGLNENGLRYLLEDFRVDVPRRPVYLGEDGEDTGGSDYRGGEP